MAETVIVTEPYKGKNLVGQRFGRLLVISLGLRTKVVDGKKNFKVRWVCECDCGVVKEILHSALIWAGTSSCGCYRDERAREATTTHGQAAFYRKQPIYTSWAGMVSRCYNKNFRQHHDYGGRGVVVCSGLRGFEGFHRKLSPTWEKGLTLDKIINDTGNYSCGECQECLEMGWPLNVRWADSPTQNRNTRRNVWLEYGGDRLVLKDMAEKYGIHHGNLRHRLKQGWTLDDAIRTPVGHRRIAVQHA